jgi:Phosphotransferase enzyme family
LSASKDRLRWPDLPAAVQASIGDLVGGTVVAAANCTGGYSPGLAARVRLADGRRAFVKAMDCAAWPLQADHYRAEAAVNEKLPPGLPVPDFLGWADRDGWVILGFECIDGAEPERPWPRAELARVLRAAVSLAAAVPPDLSDVHGRLGGWAEVLADETRRMRLADYAPWAAARLPLLTELEATGLEAARGQALVHFDMYAHNILLTAERVAFVDWPHARLGAPFVDSVLLLASASADLDPEPLLAASPLTAHADPAAVNGLLAAQAGFCLAGATSPPERGLEPIYAAKLTLGLAALGWLARRLA